MAVGAGSIENDFTPCAAHARSWPRSSLPDVRHMRDPVGQIRMISHLLVEPRIGRDHGILLVNGKSRTEAVACRMAKVDGQPRRGGKLAHGQRPRDGRDTRQVHGARELVAVDVAGRCMAHNALAASAKSDSGRQQRQARLQQDRRFIGPFFRHKPSRRHWHRRDSRSSAISGESEGARGIAAIRRSGRRMTHEIGTKSDRDIVLRDVGGNCRPFMPLRPDCRRPGSSRCCRPKIEGVVAWFVRDRRRIPRRPSTLCEGCPDARLPRIGHGRRPAA